MLISHFLKPCPLVVPGIVPELHEDVGVEADHNHQGNHKYYQEHSSKVSFLQTFGPSIEVADTFLIKDYFTKGAVFYMFNCDLKDEKTRNRRD
jgi:hypothetical protein